MMCFYQNVSQNDKFGGAFGIYYFTKLFEASYQYERASTDFTQGVSFTGSPFRAEQLKKPPCICMHTVYVMYRKIKFLSMFFSLLIKSSRKNID